MAAAKFTVQRGKVNLQDVVVATGSSEAQQETMSLNVDYNVISKGEVLILIDAIKAKIHAGPWPPLA